MKIEINVQVDIVGDPPIKIYHIKIVDKKNKAVWDETFGARELAVVFLKGVKAAFSFTNSYVEIPFIPE